MSRNVQLVLLCEDKQHEAFARRFLESAGWSMRRLRVEKAPPGKNSAEQFVRERFPKELAEYRTRSAGGAQRLIVFLDGDHRGGGARLKELDGACQAKDVTPRQDGDRVAVFVPTWNVETWLAYLDGANVDETKDNYPRLSRERLCRKHVDALHEMCQRQALRQPAPPSLDAACQEYRTRLL